MLNFQRREFFPLIFWILFLLFPALGQDDAGNDSGVNFIHGPAVVELGDGIAELKVDAGYQFADGDDNRMLMESIGNLSTNNEVGMIIPQDTTANWFVVLEYEAVGYVSDAEKDEIDADALLEGFQEGQAAANKTRTQRGFPALEIPGWYETPHYDEASHNLVWALRVKEVNVPGESVNYNTRLLGRGGYMSVVLVSDVATINKLKPEVESLLGNFSYKSGKRYLDFVDGDRLAEYGLTALIAGGAGVAAGKLGLFALIGKWFAKLWKMIAVSIAAIGGAIKKFFFGGKGEQTGDDTA